MTDYWSRPGDRDDPVFEITLTGAGGEPDQFTSHRGGANGDHRPHTERRGVWLALIAAFAIAIVAVVVIAADESGPSEQTEPTAAPLETVTPVPTAAPRTTASPSTIAMPALSLPEFPVVPGTTGTDLSRYDLQAAAAGNVPGDVPRRTMFRIVGSAADGTGPVSANARIQETLRATVANEPVAGRDRLTLEWGALESEMVVDRADEAVYGLFSRGDGSWRSIDPASLTGGSGTDRLDALLDAFIAGPITPATLERGTVTASDSLVRIVGGVSARRFDVEVPIDALQPYGALGLANISTGTVASAAAPGAITFQVYVTNQPALAMVNAEFEVADESFLLSQVFDRRPASVRIELPDPADTPALLDGV